MKDDKIYNFSGNILDNDDKSNILNVLGPVFDKINPSSHVSLAELEALRTILRETSKDFPRQDSLERPYLTEQAQENDDSKKVKLFIIPRGDKYDAETLANIYINSGFGICRELLDEFSSCLLFPYSNSDMYDKINRDGTYRRISMEKVQKEIEKENVYCIYIDTYKDKSRPGTFRNKNKPKEFVVKLPFSFYSIEKDCNELIKKVLVRITKELSELIATPVSDDKINLKNKSVMPELKAAVVYTIDNNIFDYFKENILASVGPYAATIGISSYFYSISDMNSAKDVIEAAIAAGVDTYHIHISAAKSILDSNVSTNQDEDHGFVVNMYYCYEIKNYNVQMLRNIIDSIFVAATRNKALFENEFRKEKDNDLFEKNETNRVHMKEENVKESQIFTIDDFISFSEKDRSELPTKLRQNEFFYIFRFVGTALKADRKHPIASLIANYSIIHKNYPDTFIKEAINILSQLELTGSIDTLCYFTKDRNMEEHL